MSEEDNGVIITSKDNSIEYNVKQIENALEQIKKLTKHDDSANCIMGMSSNLREFKKIEHIS